MQEKLKVVFVPVVIVLVAGFAFGLGRLSKITESKPPLVIEQAPGAVSVVLGTSTVKSQATTGKFVASRSGEKFHYPWCPGAKRISDINKVWFNTTEEAIAAGYEPAANCPGL